MRRGQGQRNPKGFFLSGVQKLLKQFDTVRQNNARKVREYMHSTVEDPNRGSNHPVTADFLKLIQPTNFKDEISRNIKGISEEDVNRLSQVLMKFVTHHRDATTTDVPRMREKTYQSYGVELNQVLGRISQRTGISHDTLSAGFQAVVRNIIK